MHIFSNFYFENITFPVVVRIKCSQVEVEAKRPDTIFLVSLVIADRGLIWKGCWKLMRSRHTWYPLIPLFLSYYISFVSGNTLDSTFKYLQNLITFAIFEC